MRSERSSGLSFLSAISDKEIIGFAVDGRIDQNFGIRLCAVDITCAESVPRMHTFAVDISTNFPHDIAISGPVWCKRFRWRRTLTFLYSPVCSGPCGGVTSDHGPPFLRRLPAEESPLLVSVQRSGNAATRAGLGSARLPSTFHKEAVLVAHKGVGPATRKLKPAEQQLPRTKPEEQVCRKSGVSVMGLHRDEKSSGKCTARPNSICCAVGFCLMSLPPSRSRHRCP